MSIVGNWKVKKIMSFDENGPKLITIDEFNAIPEKDNDMAYMASSILKITDDGVIHMLVQVPAEAIEAAKNEGTEITDDGFAVADKFEWMQRDGEFFCLNESMGTDPMPLKLDEEGCLEFMGGLLLFEKF